MSEIPTDAAGARFYFDFVDPLSYLVERELRAAEGAMGIEIERIPLEVRPPPEAPTDAADEVWRTRWAIAATQADELGVTLGGSGLVPWSRKAHELHAHARGLGAAATMRDALFQAFFAEALDIGRVDVLVEIARSVGLDAAEVKAVLDVDRYQAEVVDARREALGKGVVAAPTLALGPARLEGFHNLAALSTFLDGR